MHSFSGNTPLALWYSDWYKQFHMEQYDSNVKFLTAYMTPRKSRIPGWNDHVVFGIQAALTDFLDVDASSLFSSAFFELPRGQVETDLRWLVSHSEVLPKGNHEVYFKRVLELHELGYLPLRISALSEGTRCPVGVPYMELVNTVPDFHWVTQNIESMLSSELWPSMIYATVAASYRKMAEEWYRKTSDLPDASNAASDFNFRGSNGVHDGIKVSCAWATCFNKTATTMTEPTLRRLYGEPLPGTGAFTKGNISTEHSEHMSEFALYGTELHLIHRMLDLYPDEPFSMVFDTYDYWKLLDTLCTNPVLVRKVSARSEMFGVRGDSGDVTEIVTGTVQKLWDTFGGHTNSKGFKVLVPCVRTVFSDGMTESSTSRVFEALAEKGFSAENFLPGIGSFSFHAHYDGATGTMYPFTRDTFSTCMKATACGTVQPDGIRWDPMFKDPATDPEKMKKSHRGLCEVNRDANHVLTVQDGLTVLNTSRKAPEQALELVYTNGQLVNRSMFEVIRDHIALSTWLA